MKSLADVCTGCVEDGIRSYSRGLWHGTLVGLIAGAALIAFAIQIGYSTGQS